MPPKKVQISLPPNLLTEIDVRPGVMARGRSAFIIAAVLRYMREQEHERVDQRFAAALGGREDELFSEVEPFLAEQAWPPEDELVEVGSVPQAVANQDRFDLVSVHREHGRFPR